MNSITPTLVVLAAGMGSRYGGLKQLVPLGPDGGTLLDYSVFDARRAGFGKIVFIIRRDFESEFRAAVVAKFERRLPVEVVFQDLDDLPGGFRPPAGRTKPWGTGHATLACRHIVNEPFAVLNADDFYGRSSYATLARFLKTPGLENCSCRNAMVAFTMRKTLSDHGRVARGVCVVSDDGRLESIEELTDLHRAGSGAENRPPGGPVRGFTGDEPVSMNMWGFTPSIFPAFERVFAEFLSKRGDDPAAEFYITWALDELIRDGREQCRVLRSDSEWFGVTYQDDSPHVQSSLQRLHDAGDYPTPLWT